MPKLTNIHQTKQAKEKYSHPIIGILLERMSKEQLCEILHCSNRKAREIVSECSMYYPIISYSKKDVGYRRAKEIGKLNLDQLQLEMQEVDKAIGDYYSRIRVLKKRLKPLIAWKKVAEKRKEVLINEAINRTN